MPNNALGNGNPKISRFKLWTIGVEFTMYKKLHVFNFCIGMRIEKKVHRENKPMRDNIVFVSPNQSPKRILNMIYCVHSLPWSLYADFFFNCWKTNKKTTTLNQKWWRNTYIYRHNNDTWLTRFFWWVFFFHKWMAALQNAVSTLISIQLEKKPIHIQTSEPTQCCQWRCFLYCFPNCYTEEQTESKNPTSKQKIIYIFTLNKIRDIGHSFNGYPIWLKI